MSTQLKRKTSLKHFYKNYVTAPNKAQKLKTLFVDRHFIAQGFYVSEDMSFHSILDTQSIIIPSHFWNTLEVRHEISELSGHDEIEFRDSGGSLISLYHPQIKFTSVQVLPQSDNAYTQDPIQRIRKIDLFTLYSEIMIYCQQWHFNNSEPFPDLSNYKEKQSFKDLLLHELPYLIELTGYNSNDEILDNNNKISEQTINVYLTEVIDKMFIAQKRFKEENL